MITERHSFLPGSIKLLFWLSMFPFATGWMGENDFDGVPTALYAFVLLMAGIAYLMLQRAIIRAGARFTPQKGSRARLER
jgi:uncharacterized membrane protein